MSARTDTGYRSVPCRGCGGPGCPTCGGSGHMRVRPATMADLRRRLATLDTDEVEYDPVVSTPEVAVLRSCTGETATLLVDGVAPDGRLVVRAGEGWQGVDLRDWGRGGGQDEQAPPPPPRPDGVDDRYRWHRCRTCRARARNRRLGRRERRRNRRRARQGDRCDVCAGAGGRWVRPIEPDDHDRLRRYIEGGPFRVEAIHPDRADVISDEGGRCYLPIDGIGRDGTVVARLPRAYPDREGAA